LETSVREGAAGVPRACRKTPFFIAGAGRSGSTYLYYVLKDHPRVALTNEFQVLAAIALALEAVTLPYGRRNGTGGFLGIIHPTAKPVFEQIFRERTTEMFEEFYDRYFSHDFTHFGDKLPDPYAAGHFARCEPRTKIVLMVRDPRDVVSSYLALAKLPHDLGPRQGEMAAMSIASFAGVWKRSYEALLGLVPSYHVVDYVDLIDDPRRIVSGVLEYLGLDPAPQVDLAIETNDTIGGHGTSRTAAETIGRWRRDLSPKEASEVVEICGPMMEKLGVPV
jgi:hypothetical protein